MTLKGPSRLGALDYESQSRGHSGARHAGLEVANNKRPFLMAAVEGRMVCDGGLGKGASADAHDVSAIRPLLFWDEERWGAARVWGISAASVNGRSTRLDSLAGPSRAQAALPL